MKITVFVNDQSEFRMRLQSESKNSYQNLETLTLTDVTEKDIYTFMRNAGFDRTEAQNFTRRLKKRFDTSLFKLAVSKCKKIRFLFEHSLLSRIFRQQNLHRTFFKK
ncbi:hypothetical protein HJ192_08040 [Vibrio parahaemolyticus]|nr:hypothetical protein [Vibrio parahaemolyticus]